MKDYTHSTAPNRRYPDLITQRLLKAAHRWPRGAVQLRRAGGAREAVHREGGRRQQGRAPGRQVRRGAAPRVEDRRAFAAIVTGASDKGTWARLFTVPVEGRVVRGFEGAGRRRSDSRAADRHVNVERGFIDFQASRREGSIHLDDAIAFVKPWVRFTGGVLVVAVLYWAQAPITSARCWSTAGATSTASWRCRACLSQATRMLPWARPRAELFRTDTSDLYLLRLNAVPSPSLAETEAGQS